MGLLTIEDRPLYRTDAAAHVIVREASGGELELAQGRTGEMPISVWLGLGGRDATLAYADRVCAAAEALEADVRTQIVYADPAELAGPAGDYGTGVPAAVAELQARATKRGPAQTAKDLEFARRYRPWLIALLAYRASLTGFDWTGPQASTAWERMQQYETELRGYETQFRALGQTSITTPLPATLETPTGEKKATDEGPAWLKPVLYTGTAIAVAWGLSSIARTVRG